MTANTARGEVDVKVGGEDLVLALTMQGLATLSKAADCKSMQEFMDKVGGAEPDLMLSALQFTSIDGDVKAAMENMNFPDFFVIAGALREALEAHIPIVEDMPGKPQKGAKS